MAGHKEPRGTKMIKVKKITFGDIEGNIKATDAILGRESDTDKVSFDSIEKANEILFQLACLRTSEQYGHGYYNKCDLTIEWENGECWGGRWDINSLELGKEHADCEIKSHILRHCKYWLKNHPAKLDKENTKQYKAIIDGIYELG